MRQRRSSRMVFSGPYVHWKERSILLLLLLLLFVQIVCRNIHINCVLVLYWEHWICCLFLHCLCVRACSLACCCLACLLLYIACFKVHLWNSKSEKGLEHLCTIVLEETVRHLELAVHCEFLQRRTCCMRMKTAGRAWMWKNVVWNVWCFLLQYFSMLWWLQVLCLAGSFMRGIE